MTFISVTRLRLRSVRFLPAFGLYTFRSLRQIKKSPGFQGGSLLPDRGWAFWTMTAWDSEESMRAYILAGAHRAAMPRLVGWCDEAAVVHWDQATVALPSWPEADRRLREDGRASKVRFPSPHHASLSHQPPRLGAEGKLRPVRAA